MENKLLRSLPVALLALTLMMIGSGCRSTGGVPITDSFGRSPDSQRLMNQAVDRFVSQIDLSSLGAKSVKITTQGTVTGSAMDITMKNTAGSMQMSGGQDISEIVQQAMGGTGYSAYLKAQLERKVSAQGGKCIQNNPDAQVVINAEAAGLKRRIYYVSALILPLDIYQHRKYWAILDGTVDIKTGDNTRILDSQKITAESSACNKPAVFKSSIGRNHF